MKEVVMNTCSREDLLKLPHKFQVLFAVYCAKQVLHLVREKDKEVAIAAIEATEGFVEGRVTAEECRAVADAAYAAANYATAYAATSAAAYAAVNAATSAAAYDKTLIQEQWDYYDELLNFDKNFEEIVLMEQI